MSVVYCAYCGKSFTRKEHLERHLPTHTNVKPHRCSCCHLSFARRDLLQRHHATYHEPRDPMEPLPGGVPTFAGKTPIACQNCASAKTGCDKRVPCTRCAEKNLECTARFARRSSKAALRAAHAQAAMTPLRPPSQIPLPGNTINPSMMEVDGIGGHSGDGGKSPEATLTGDSKAICSPKIHSPIHAHVSPGEYTLPLHPVRLNTGLDDFLLPSEFVSVDYSTGYGEMGMWQDYGGMDMNWQHSTIPIRSADISTMFDMGNISPVSEPMTASSSQESMHTRGTSISTHEYDHNITSESRAIAVTSKSMSTQDFERLIDTEAGWNLARCNKPPTDRLRPTAIHHLECLERRALEEGTWRPVEEYLKKGDWDASNMSSVVSFTSSARDQMLAMTQGFLHRALEVHRAHGRSRGATKYEFNYVVLPPSHILEHFLRSYVRSLSVYYPLVTAGQVDPNEMLQTNSASVLLVLLMIAQGAAAMPVAEAQHLSAGLTETCRISLFDMVEKDVQHTDPISLRCALLFIVLGAWSGDKWLMDTAMGQRGMYMSMLKYAGMMEPQPAMIPSFDSTSKEAQWRQWVDRESRNRLVYNYVMLDQELSLFHDTVPLFAITELQCPLPGAEALWQSTNAEQWFANMQSVYGFSANLNPQILTSTPDSVTPSLYVLFQEFLQGNLSSRQQNLSPQQLRLILHPIQAMLCHLGQLVSCFDHDIRRTANTVTKSSSLERIAEVQSLLSRWYDMTKEYVQTHPDCPVTRCNLVLYHLISLNAFTYFPEIERLARREGFSAPLSVGASNPTITHWDITLRYKKCIFQREKAVFHSGQIFWLLRQMPGERRPAWWPVAMYRATLVLWIDSLSRLDPSFQQGVDEKGGANGNAAGQVVAIDQMVPEERVLDACSWGGNGMAVLSRYNTDPASGNVSPSTGVTQITMDKPEDILDYTIRNIDAVGRSRVGDGIKRKLETLGKNWSEESILAGGGGIVVATG
ncbi:hypothetical protein QBC38DRAFT_357468 [Podospora fimiseda]|uniref:Transcription factor n=1 Tax=Podospora fimiseda TaxID=252190 RepID=A0AAN7H2J6_9PEZI|nr:hypothetical protein QBC38DRAFT_357468 [Podospora fimiseda]